MAEPNYYRLPIDDRSRITLSKVLKPSEKITSFYAHREGNRIVLEPMVEIPAEQTWVWEDPELLTAFERGLKQKGEHDLGSFAEFADDEI